MENSIFSRRIKRILPVGVGDHKNLRLYWMQSAQRAIDNMALNYAASLCAKDNKQLIVTFFISTQYPGANMRHFHFMMQGLAETAIKLADMGIPFICIADAPWRVLPTIENLADVITETAYLRHLRLWRSNCRHNLEEQGIGFAEVESEVLIPAHLVSDKQEYAAATIRRKITRLWLEVLEAHQDEQSFFMGSPQLYLNKTGSQEAPPVRQMLAMPEDIVCFSPSEIRCITSPQDFIDLLEKHSLPVPDTSIAVSTAFKGGQSAAMDQLDRFLDDSFSSYGAKRNDPADPMQSDLSPYLHFGMISIHRIAWEVVKYAELLRQKPKLKPEAVPSESLEAFLEEIIVRRELAKNFCLHNMDYDSYKGIPAWAKESLEKHASDVREQTYSRQQLEKGETYDPYWNACQLEMVKTGKMHGYMRMYWAKKVLEWSHTPQAAFETLVYLNDRYSLDGRDENGYAGISWCFGTHDRGWKERPIFGKIRYMNDKGLERKFDIKSYAQRWIGD